MVKNELGEIFSNSTQRLLRDAEERSDERKRDFVGNARKIFIEILIPYCGVFVQHRADNLQFC